MSPKSSTLSGNGRLLKLLLSVYKQVLVHLIIFLIKFFNAPKVQEGGNYELCRPN